MNKVDSCGAKKASLLHLDLMSPLENKAWYFSQFTDLITLTLSVKSSVDLETGNIY